MLRKNGEFLKELQEASSRGIVVVNLTQCMSGKVNMGGYATGNALAQAGDYQRIRYDGRSHSD
ncbi:L-asparaginase 1 [Leclercia adecarboxylata]|uniref:L-asparaginase 1 n=1 Tax=Leclercia adecarboxylata TaxID=83655 RepID=A0A4U9HRA7_9ENTR|nr:L-asparaginase 1 [Leclercia adecarboxylata]